MKIDDIRVKTISHKEHRYPTVGDWWITTDNVSGRTTLDIRVSDMGDWRGSIAVAVHEIVEAVCCIADGIDPKSLDRFDTAYEAIRAGAEVAGMHGLLTVSELEAARDAADGEEAIEEFGGHDAITEDSEPGEDLHAPYRHQHALATQVEWIVSEGMHLPWKLYEQEIAELDAD